MHARALAFLALLSVGGSAFAQTPPITPPAPPAVPGRPLLTEPPIEPSDAPANIPVSPDPSLTALENAVLAAHDAAIAALEARDLGRLAALLLPTNRGAMIVDGKLILTRDEVLDARRREFAELSQVNYAYRQRHVTVLSPTTAILVGDGVLTALVADGTRVERPFAHTVVLTNHDASWKIAHWHSSTVKPHLLE